MKHILLQWYDRYFSEPSAWVLMVVFSLCFSVIYFWGTLLAPVFASVVLSYLLDGLVIRLFWWCPRLYAVLVIYVLFILGLSLLFFQITPSLIQELSRLMQQMPAMFHQAQERFNDWHVQYPALFPSALLNSTMLFLSDSLAEWGRTVLSFSLSTIPGLFAVLVYVFLVPLLVFFMLKDKEILLNWFDAHLPEDRHLIDRIWHVVKVGIAQYIQGKLIEALLVWFLSYLIFLVFHLQYSFLLSVLIGISVFIPYIGGILASIPIFMVALFQWHLSPHFGWFTLVYLLVQIIESNVVAPILFSGAVNTHPVAIIVAILLFGGLWGFWGLFFSVPLAVLFKAIFEMWPRSTKAVSCI